MQRINATRVLFPGVLLLLSCTGVGASCLQLPSDALPMCPVAAPLFSSWFDSGAVTLDGVVKPADSVNFPNVPNCSFYEWSQQMFLWAMSPAPAAYGGSGRIFESPAFYDVSPPDTNGDRTLTEHTQLLSSVFNLRQAQVGPHLLPIVPVIKGYRKTGGMVEIALPPTGPSNLPQVRKGHTYVEVGSVALSPKNKPIFMDQGGDVIRGAKPIYSKELRRASIVQKFIITATGAPILVGASGHIAVVEQGQSDGGVLQTQNGVYTGSMGSLVYYSTFVNDVFAYFLTGAKDNVITPATQFPTTQAELNAITAFASSHGKTFPDPEALAVELKMSWVLAAGLANLSSYITTTATIPTYDTSDPNHWTPTGQQTVQLALVGVHVVGSTKGHPEMVWATFEHVCNAPDAIYSYKTASGTTTVPQSTIGDWLFAANGSAAPFNVMHMNEPFGTLDIASLPTFTISPSDTIRWKAWGMGTNSSNVANSNTQVISINNDVRGMLVAGDVRNNYVMTGATWTIGGNAPNANNQVGTNKLANTTMETYQQGSDPTKNTGLNCFGCHVTNTTDVSHVYPAIAPLF